VVTVKDIAKKCGVSASTVSNILNGRSNVGEQTRQRVLKCVEETGYQPNYFAQNIRNQGNRMISIITEDLTVFGTTPGAEAIMEYCDENNYRTVLINLRLYKKWKSTFYNDPEKVKTVLNPALQEALAIRVKGIIYFAGHCRLIDYFPQEFPIPVVIAYGLSQDNKYPSIVIDDEKGGYDMTCYLTERGHKKIGLIAGAIDNLHSMSRLLGYQKGLYENNILYNPSLVYYGNWRRASGYLGAKKLLEIEGLTAIFCMNDEMAVGAYDYLYEKNIRVGEEISIIGFDNMELSDYIRPRLTTNEIQLVEIGKKSAEVMIETIEGTRNDYSGASPILMPCRIIERDSVCDITKA